MTFAPLPDSTFFLNTPYLLKQGRFAGDGIDNDGFGDVTLGGKYRFFREDDILETTQFSFLGGAKLPVGNDDETQSGSRLPLPLQLGTGSFDFFTGVVFTHQADRIRFDAYEFEFVVEALADARQTQLAVGEPAAGGGTRLRAEPQPAGNPPVGEAAGPEPEDDAAEAKTRLKPDMCPNHPAWKATELCPACKRALCHSCMTQKNGRSVCVECSQS